MIAACGTSRGRDGGGGVEDAGDPGEASAPFDIVVTVPQDAVRRDATADSNGDAPTIDGAMGETSVTGDSEVPDVPPPDNGILPIEDVPVPPGTLPAPGPCRLLGETAVLASDPAARARPVFGFANARGFTFGTATSRMGAQNVWVARLTSEGSVTSVFPSTMATGELRGGAVADTRRETNALLYSSGDQLIASLAYYTGSMVSMSQRTVSATAAAGDAVDLVPYGESGLDGLFAIWRETIGGRGVLKLVSFTAGMALGTPSVVRDISGADNVGDFDGFAYSDGGDITNMGVVYLTAGASSEVVVQWLGADGAPGAAARLGAASGARGVAGVGTAAGATVVYGEASGTNLHAAQLVGTATTATRDLSLGAMTANAINPSIAMDGPNATVAFRAPLTGGSGRAIAVARIDSMLAVREVSFLATASEGGRITIGQHSTGRFGIGWADLVGTTTTVRAAVLRCD